MDTDFWRLTLVSGLALNATLGLGYRVYRLTKGGPIADAWGQAVLAAFLGLIAAAIGLGSTWPRWIALVYAVLFALVAMPVWVLGVLLPLPPRAIDYSFTAVYWMVLIVIAVAAIAL
ncbi:MAG: hypothetical protein ACRDKT_13610 [Actinomycetota bacterium]